MRTNIVLDDELMEEARKYSTGRSKREVVREALATYVTVKSEQQRVTAYRDRLAAVRRRLAATSSPAKSSRDILRADRDRAS